MVNEVGRIVIKGYYMVYIRAGQPRAPIVDVAAELAGRDRVGAADARLAVLVVVGVGRHHGHDAQVRAQRDLPVQSHVEVVDDRFEMVVVVRGQLDWDGARVCACVKG